MLQLKKGKEFNPKDYTVILPSICVGNAAQLACDLLISSKALNRIGSISHAALIPVFGPSAYQHEPNENVASCEIYENTKDKLIVIQFRTPLISRHTKDFHEYLAELLKEARRVIILSGSFGFEKRIIEDSPYAYQVNETFKKSHESELENVVWKEYTGEVIYGGGNAMQLYKSIGKNVPSMLLFRYLLEGDNSTDAKLIIRELNDLCADFLHLKNQNDTIKLTVPISWNLLFGNEAPDLIF